VNRASQGIISFSAPAGSAIPVLAEKQSYEKAGGILGFPDPGPQFEHSLCPGT
jgi:hypothetical protein